MNRLLRFYIHLNTLSIDVALGAICCCAWFAKLYHVTLRPYAYIALGLTVWIIYTADHLLDARNIKTYAVTARHKFHQQHFNVLVVLVGCAMVLNVVMIFFVRKQVLYAGVILAAMVLLYLLFTRVLSFLKELVVALLYTGGVLLPVLSIMGWGKSISHPIVITLFFITALINLILFAWFDYDADKHQGYTSFSVQFGKYLTMQFLCGLFLIQAILIVTVVLYHQMVWEGLMLFSMNAILFLLFTRFTRVFISRHYRLLGDAVFLIPALFLTIG
jgi:4-hydroxybenzoate polyprenyltransferase